MPIRPDAETMGAYDAYLGNPNFGHDAIEAMLNDDTNECSLLRDALLSAGLIEEVKDAESGSSSR